MERTRAGLLESKSSPLAWRLRALFLREVIANPARLRLMASALRLYQGSGMRSLVERMPLLGERSSLALGINGRPYLRTGVLARPRGKTVRRVGFLTGCIMPLAYGRVHRATVRVLARNDCEVIAPPEQVCCGALHAHNGDLRTARDLARRNIDAFLAQDLDAIVVNSAGCGAAMKEYAELLEGDPRAARFAGLVRDIHEFLLDLPLAPPPGRLDLDITVQDSCHLAHAQRLAQAPRDILARIPGIQVTDMRHPDRCCGSAGVYSLTQPEMSLQLLRGKMREIQATGARVIATANPGCMAQLEAGTRRYGSKARVVHVMELLDEAYRA
jgi:glycolate oxidase iron-sulfur subunit